MKTWYKAVCDNHKLMIDMFVNNIETTKVYLADVSDIINNWLQVHYGCSLRLIHNDYDVDDCFNKGYKNLTSSIHVNNVDGIKLCKLCLNCA